MSIYRSIEINKLYQHYSTALFIQVQKGKDKQSSSKKIIRYLNQLKKERKKEKRDENTLYPVVTFCLSLYFFFSFSSLTCAIANTHMK
jgi:hypothetical protein